MIKGIHIHAYNIYNICEKILDSESKLKEHNKSEHTYHSVRYQCNECEFIANEISTLQVHLRTNHSVKKTMWPL